MPPTARDIVARWHRLPRWGKGLLVAGAVVGLAATQRKRVKGVVQRITKIVDPAPENVVGLIGRGGKRVQLERGAAAAYQQLVAAARAAGFGAPLLEITSGYRPGSLQERLWKEALEKYGSPAAARKWVAPPGKSAHQTGRAIDFWLGGQNSSENVAQLRKLPVYVWLRANAGRWGFVPYEAEPWHWEHNPGVV